MQLNSNAQSGSQFRGPPPPLTLHPTLDVDYHLPWQDRRARGSLRAAEARPVVFLGPLLLALGTPRRAMAQLASPVAHSSDRGAPPGVRLIIAERLVRGSVRVGVRRVGVRVGIRFGVRVGIGLGVRVGV